MVKAIAAIAMLGSLTCGQTPAQPSGSLLYRFEPKGDGTLVCHAENYVAQPGDMVFFDDHSKFWAVCYKYVGSGPPFHSGLVFAMPDGTPAVLEAGPDDTQWVRLLKIPQRFQNFKGDVWIRRVKTPLTPEENQKLTEFALAQDGKRYAFWRLLLQGTPVRCRSDWRLTKYGATYLDRERWLCSEIVVAGGTIVGRFDPTVHFANAIYPRDIIHDTKYDLSAQYHEARFWAPSLDRLPPGPVPR